MAAQRLPAHYQALLNDMCTVLQDLHTQHLASPVSLQTVLLLGFHALDCVAARLPDLAKHKDMHHALTRKVQAFPILPLDFSCCMLHWTSAKQHLNPQRTVQLLCRLLPDCKLAQAFELTQLLLLLKLISAEQRELLFFVSPERKRNEFGLQLNVAEGWQIVMAPKIEAYLAAAGQANIELPSIHDVGQALMRKDPFVQQAICDWARSCPVLAGSPSHLLQSGVLSTVHAEQVRSQQRGCT